MNAPLMHHIHNTLRPLTESELRLHTPSIFTDHPYHKVSDKYEFISTRDVLDALTYSGWQPVWASQSKSLTATDYTRHMLRFRRFDDQCPAINDTWPEIVIVNSHDRSSTFQLHAGLFRLVCENGLVIADKSFNRMRYRHIGHSVWAIIEGVYEIIEDLPTIASRVENYASLPLTKWQTHQYAFNALALRWPNTNPLLSPDEASKPRRDSDANNDLWTVYQRVQENLVNGVPSYATAQRSVVRPIRAVDTLVRLNKGLWELTEETYQLIASAA